MTIALIKAAVGAKAFVSDWMTVDQAMIDAFADLTGDHNFIHVDVDRAKQSAFGGTIAHGFLVLSFVPQMADAAGVPRADDAPVSLNYGMDRLRFISPVRCGARVRGRFVVDGCDEKRPGRYQKILDVTIEIEGEDRPALAARWIMQLVA
jgi:acyl dehydratase